MQQPIFTPQPKAPTGDAFAPMPKPAPVAPITPPVQSAPAPVQNNQNTDNGTAPVTTLAQVIAYSKANPTSQYAKQAYTLIKNGSFDAQAAKEGIDLSWAGRPKAAADVKDTQGQDKGQTAPQSPTLGDLDMQQLQQAGQKIVDSVQNAGTKEAHDANGTVFGEAKGVGDVLEGLLGSGAGIVQGISAPVSAVLQKVIEMDPAKLKAGAADPSLAGNPTEKAAAEFAAAHPELTQNLRDALTVGGAVYGGAEGLIPGGNTSLGEFAQTGKTMLEDAATRVKAAAAPAAETAPALEQAAAVEGVTKPGAIKSVRNSAIASAIGVQPSTVEDILKNPDMYTTEKMAEASRQGNAEFVKEGINKKVQQLEKMKQGVTPRDLADQVETGLQFKEHDLKQAARNYGSITGDRAPGSTAGPSVKVPKGWLEKQIQEITGRPVKNGIIDTTPNAASTLRNSKDVSSLQKWLNDHNTAFKKGTLSGNEFLNVREDLADLANYDHGGAPSNALEKTGASLRANLNDRFRPGFKGLQKADADYEEQKNDLDRLKVGLIDNQGNLSENAMTRIRNATNGDKFDIGNKLEALAPGIKARVQKLNDIETEQQRYRAGIVDEKGNLLDNAANVVHNASGVGKDLLSNRLEEVAPGIGDRVRYLKGVEDIQSAKGIKTGTYLKAGLTLLNGPFGLASLVLTHPDVAVPLLRRFGASADEASKIVEDLGVAQQK